MLKLSLAALLLAALSGAGCSHTANVFPKQTPQQIVLEALTAAEFGVDADATFGAMWLTDADRRIFDDVDMAIRAAVAHDPTTALVSAVKILGDLLNDPRLPATAKIRPYLDALNVAFGQKPS